MTAFPQETFNEEEFLSFVSTGPFAATVVTKDKEVEACISDMLYGTKAGWDTLHTWIRQQTTGDPAVRWAALLSAVSYAKRVTYAVLQMFPTEYPEVFVRTIVDLYSLSQDGELGVRDALYIMTVADSPHETLENDWIWYATPECPPARYSALLLTFFLVVGQHMEDIASLSPVPTERLTVWEAILLRMS